MAKVMKWICNNWDVLLIILIIIIITIILQLTDILQPYSIIELK